MTQTIYMMRIEIYFDTENVNFLLCRFRQLVAVVVGVCTSQSSDVRSVSCSSDGDAVVLRQSQISGLHQQCHCGNAAVVK